MSRDGLQGLSGICRCKARFAFHPPDDLCGGDLHVEIVVGRERLYDVYVAWIGRLQVWEGVFHLFNEQFVVVYDRELTRKVSLLLDSDTY